MTTKQRGEEKKKEVTGGKRGDFLTEVHRLRNHDMKWISSTKKMTQRTNVKKASRLAHRSNE